MYISHIRIWLWYTDATHYYDNDLLLRQEIQKRSLVLEADMITIKNNNIDLMSVAQRMYFSGTCSK